VGHSLQKLRATRRILLWVLDHVHQALMKFFNTVVFPPEAIYLFLPSVLVRYEAPHLG
jgi:hypothetical protein